MKYHRELATICVIATGKSSASWNVILHEQLVAPMFVSIYSAHWTLLSLVHQV